MQAAVIAGFIAARFAALIAIRILVTSARGRFLPFDYEKKQIMA
jgi:hypothetical protein